MIYRTLIVLSIIAFFAIMLFDTGGPTLPYATVDVPQFLNPFDEVFATISNGTALPDAPYLDDTTSYDWMITTNGCVDSTYEGTNCINTDDGENSYIRINIGAIPIQARILFNWTYPGLLDIDHTSIRRTFYTISCRTVSANITPPLFIIAGMSAGTGYLTCPRGNSFSKITIQDDYPAGKQDFIPDVFYDFTKLLHL